MSTAESSISANEDPGVFWTLIPLLQVKIHESVFLFCFLCRRQAGFHFAAVLKKIHFCFYFAVGSIFCMPFTKNPLVMNQSLSFKTHVLGKFTASQCLVNVRFPAL